MGRSGVRRHLNSAPASAVHDGPEVQAVLDVVKSPKSMQAKPEAFFDNSFLQKVEASGFINSLYAR